METDSALLIPKARAALERYGHQVVIGNDLLRRKYEVIFVSRKPLPSLPLGAAVTLPGASDPTTGSDTSLESTFQESWLRIDIASPSPDMPASQIKEIEEDIVAELVRRHIAWIEAGGLA